MKKKVIKTIITSAALSTSLSTENLLSEISEETNIEEQGEIRKDKVKKRTKRQTIPSLEQIITTINIGEIEINNQAHIIQRLREINHPILSREDFLENIEFENITNINAVVHTRTNIIDEDSTRFISKKFKFTINFRTQIQTLSSSIININLGELLDNSPQTIINRLNRLNPNLNLNYPIFLRRFPINLNSFNILAEDFNDFQQNNRHLIFDRVFTFTFTVNSESIRLSSLIRNTNLGEIESNDPNTIMERMWELNPDLIYHFDFLGGANLGSFITPTTLVIPRANMFFPEPIIYTNLNIIYDCDISVTFTTRNPLPEWQSITSTTTPSTSSQSSTSNANQLGSSDESLSTSPSSTTSQSTNGINNIILEEKNEIKQFINSTLLKIYNNTSHKTKNEAKNVLKNLYGNHFTDDSWKQFEKLIELHKYGIVFIGQTINDHSNKNKYKTMAEKLVGTSTAVSVPTGYLAVKTSIAPTATTTVTEESIPLLETSVAISEAEGGVIIVGETAMSEGGIAIIEGSAILGPIGLLIVGGGIVIGGISYLIYNWTHADVHHANVNSHSQYNIIIKDEHFNTSSFAINTPPYTSINIGIKTNTWIELAKIYQEHQNDYSKFEQKFIEKINNFKKNSTVTTSTFFSKKTRSLAINNISNSDLKKLAKVIYNNFTKINIFYLITNQHGWKIKINNIGDTFTIEPEE